MKSKMAFLSYIKLFLMALIMACAINKVQGQEISVDSQTDIKTVKHELREHSKHLSQERKKLDALLKDFKDISDSTISDQILTSFSEVTTTANQTMPELDRLKSKAGAELSDRDKKQYQRLSQKWKHGREEWQQYARQDSSLRNYWQQLKGDTVLMAKAEQKLVDHFKKELGDGVLLPDGENPMEMMQETFKQLEGFTDKEAAYQQLTDGAFEYSAEELKSMTPDKVLGPLLGKDDIVESAHNEMWKLKQKYSFVQNSNDLSTAIKANSLQGKPLSQRLKLGGNLQFHPVKGGLKLDLSPTLGYRFNKDFLLGLGATYRANFGKRDQLNEPINVYGARLFAQQKLIKSFFVHAEGEYLSTETEKLDSESTETKQTSGFLAGLGREFKFIKGLNASALWLYHFNHTRTLAYKSPWVFRLGLNIDTKK
jgi:uncharacterized coiled-coil protein SlyX